MIAGGNRSVLWYKASGRGGVLKGADSAGG